MARACRRRWPRNTYASPSQSIAVQEKSLCRLLTCHTTCSTPAHARACAHAPARAHAHTEQLELPQGLGQPALGPAAHAVHGRAAVDGRRAPRGRPQRGAVRLPQLLPGRCVAQRPRWDATPSAFRRHSACMCGCACGVGRGVGGRPATALGGLPALECVGPGGSVSVSWGVAVADGERGRLLQWLQQMTQHAVPGSLSSPHPLAH